MNDPEVAPIEDVAPVFAESMIRQRMAQRYQRAVPDLTDEEARNAATATWESEWETDPRPRTFEAADEAVDSALEYWDGE
jgi:hypothetical protein